MIKIDFHFLLKDKLRVGMIVDYSRDYTFVNGVQYFFTIFSPFNLKNYIFQSAKKCEMTSFSTASLHVDLNEAANVLYYTTHIASLLIVPSHTRTKYQMVTIFGLTYEDSLTNL